MTCIVNLKAFETTLCFAYSMYLCNTNVKTCKGVLEARFSVVEIWAEP